MQGLLDHDLRQWALDASHSFIVQAPAGSGKTELLTQRLLVLLCTVNQPEEIIALTFTRKAALEMRQRVLQALRYAHTHPEPAAPHQRLTWQLAQHVLTHSAALEWNLLANPHRLRIQTIDGLCASLTRQMPVLSQSGLGATISDNPASIYRQAAEAIMAHIDIDVPWSNALNLLLLHLDNRYEKVIELLVTMLSNRDQWLPHIMNARNQDDLRNLLEDGLQHVVTAHLNYVAPLLHRYDVAELVALGNYAASQAPTDMQTILAILQQPYETSRSKIEFYQAVAHLLLTNEGQWRKRLDKNLGFPAASNAQNAEEKSLFTIQKTRMQQWLSLCEADNTLRTALSDVLELPPSNYDNQQWQIISALLEILPRLVAQTKILFSTYNTVDFIEIMQSALHALGATEQPTDLALYYDYRIAHLLIDEFQDTSNTQFRLIERLTQEWYPGDGRTLFIVGDPMQSIYRFRQAEVSLFTRVQQTGISQLHPENITLSTNFRSAEGVVTWVNHAFTRIFPEQAITRLGAIPYSVASSTKTSDEGNVLCHNLFDTSAQAQQVLRILQQIRRNDNSASIAILVKARSHLTEILPLLAEHAIDYQAIDLDPLASRPIIQDLWSLTKAILHIGDRLAWFSILRAPFCGLRLTDLEILATKNIIFSGLCDPDLQQKMTSDGQCIVQRIMPILCHAIEQRQRSGLHDAIADVWQALGGPACYPGARDLADAKQFFNLLAIEQRGGDLSDYTTFSDKLARLYANPGQANNNPVQVMTIHKSKGLEFDYVIIPSAERSSTQDAAKLLQWAEAPSPAGFDLLLAPIKASDQTTDPIYQYLRRQESAKQQYELARVLYVAITRAKRECHILFTATRKQDGNWQQPPKNSLLAQLWPALQLDSAAPAIAADDGETDIVEVIPQPQPLQRLVSGWTYPLPSRWQETSFNREATTTPTEQPHYLTQVETLTHRLLQQFAQNGMPATANALSRDKITSQLALVGVSPDNIDHATTLVLTALTNCINDPRSRWLFAADHKQGHAEYVISYIDQQQLRQAVIDRWFITKNDELWLVDYKINANNDELTQYEAQLQRCATHLASLHSNRIFCAVYFPLESRWHEWQFGDNNGNS